MAKAKKPLHKQVYRAWYNLMNGNKVSDEQKNALYSAYVILEQIKRARIIQDSINHEINFWSSED